MLPNLRRLSLAIFVLLIAAVSIHGLHTVRQGRSVELLRRAVEQERKSNDPQRLILAIKRYLLVESGDMALRTELLDLRADHARTDEEMADVYHQLQELLKNHPEDSAHRSRLISYALRLAEYQDVLANVEYLESVEGKSAQFLMWKGEAQSKTANVEGAIQSYREAIQLDPHRIDAYIALASILRNESNASEESRYWIQRLTEANPKSSEAFLAQARFYLDCNDLKDSLKSVESAMQLAENRTEGVLLWSDIVMAAGERDELDTKQTWKERDAQISDRLWQAWESDPDEPRIASKLSAICLRKNEPDEAEKLLRQGLDRAAKDPLLTWELADLLITRGRKEESRPLIGDLQLANVSRPLIDYLRGRILVQEQRWSEAVVALQRARGDLIDTPRLAAQAEIYLADCYEELGDSDQRLGACRHAVQIQPFFVAARQHLAQALLAVGRVDEALAEYRTMLDLPDAPAFGWTAEVGWATVAKVLIIRNLSIPKEKANWDEIEPALNSLTQAAPNSIEAVLLRAEVLAAKSQIAEAKDVLLKYPIETSPDVRWWVALIQLSLREGNFTEAEQRLQEALQAQGQNVELNTMQIQLAVLRGERDREKLSHYADESTGLAPADRARLMYELAGFYVSLGMITDAKVLWSQITQLTPQDLRVWLYQFDAAINQSDFETCSAIIDGMRRIEGKEGTYTQLSETLLILRLAMSGKDSSRIETARATLTSLQVRRPRWARVPWALGLLDELSGRREHAVESYLLAFDLGDRSPELVRRTLDLLLSLHRYDLAEDLIHRWEQLPNAPILPEINRMAAEISIERQNPQLALTRALRAVSESSTNFQDHLWLAWIYRATGQMDQAEQKLETAVKLAPTAGETWVTLIQHFLAQNRRQDAETLLERVRSEVPAESQAAVLAGCYEALGRYPEAEVEFVRAIEDAPSDRRLLAEAADFFRRQLKLKESERLWRQLLELSVDATIAERSSVRRGLAYTLAQRGDYPAFCESLNLVEQNLKDLPKSMLDLRAKASLLAVRGDPKQRKVAVELFDQLSRVEPLSSQDQSLLAAAYESTGDLERAHEAWQSLVAAETENPIYLSKYVSVLLKRHALTDAKIWLERLQKAAPDWKSTLELQAEIDLQEGRVQEVLDAFQRHVDQAEDPESRLRCLVESGEALERLANTKLRQSDELRNQLLKAAEVDFREYVEQQPKRLPVLAGYFARHGQVDEALKLFDQSWEIASPALVSSVLTASLCQVDPTPEQLARAVTSITQHLPVKPPASMLTDLAAFAELQQDFDRAEKLYRDVLAAEPRNIVALNNLAFLLAMQSRNLNEASELLAKAFTLVGPSPSLLDTRALIALMSGQLDVAQEDREAVTYEAPSAAAWFRLAIVYQQQKNLSKMREAAQKARDAGLVPGDLHFLERRYLDVILKSLAEET